MNTKIMEGLAGAGKNRELLNTPMRVYKEARRKGDTATMERAMGYAEDFADKAEEYRLKADEGVKEDAKDTRKKAELEAEKAVRKRKEEREELEKELEEKRNQNTDTVEISEEGMALLEDNANPENAGPDSESGEAAAGTERMVPVGYTKTGGAAVQPAPETGISVSV